MSKQNLHFLFAALSPRTTPRFIGWLGVLLLTFWTNPHFVHASTADAMMNSAIVLLNLNADLNGDGDALDPNEMEIDGAGIPVSLQGNGLVNVETCSSDIPNQPLKIQINCNGCPDNAAYEYDLSINDKPLISTNNPIDFNVNTIFLDGTDLQIGDNRATVELYEILSGSRTLVDTRAYDFIVTTEETLACNNDVNIGANSLCSTIITADAVVENPCEDVVGNELLGDYQLELTLISVSEAFVNSRNIPLPGILNNNSSAVTLQIPGRYRYSVRLGDNTCWGFINLEDKQDPVCDPALDLEVPVDWDHDCNPSTRNTRRPDPSGVDDLAPEYILCELIEREGVDIFFDELEAEDGFVDYNNNGRQDSNEPSYLGDFQDCSGIKEIYHEDEVIEVCTLDDLNDIPVDVSFYDVDRYEVCTVYIRTWFAVDNTGRKGETGCTQYVFSLRPKANAIQIDEEAAVECGNELNENLTYPYYQVRPGDIFNNGAGSVNNFPFVKEYRLVPFQNRCKYAVTYHEDPPILLCGTGSNAYKQTRHWSVLDWCDGERVFSDFTQLLKVEDTTAPTACLVGTQGYLPTDTTIVTQLFECTAQGSIPELLLKDVCSDAEFTSVEIVGTASNNHGGNEVFIPNLTNGQDITSLGLHEGDYRIIYRFEDVCGNRDEVVINLTFIDPRFPQAICNDELHVTLIPSGKPGDQRARIYAEDLDDTSFDNCHPLIYDIRLSGDLDGEWVEHLEFDCSDTDAPVKVELRVTGDANNNGRVDEGELSSRCWTFIRLEDKTAPELNINNGSFFCDDREFDRIILNTGEYPVNSDVLFPTIVGSCSADGVRLRLISVDMASYDPVCNVGVITRDFVAFRNSTHGNLFGQPVSQTISIQFRADWTMKFPTDVTVECNPNIDDNFFFVPEPERIEDILTNRACDQWGMETEDEIFDITGVDGSGACFKIIRTYKFINWCTWDPTNTELGVVPRPLDFFTDPRLCVTLDYQSDGVANICALQNNIDDGRERLNDPYNLLINNNGNGVVDLISELDADFIYVDEDQTVGGDDVFGTGDCIDDGFNAIFNTTIDRAASTSNNLIDDEQLHNLVSAEAYGYFIYRQVIKVVDNEAPVFTPIENFDLCDEDGDCRENFKLPIPEVTDCKDEYTITYSVDINRDGDTNDGNENGRILGNATDGFTTPFLNVLEYGTYTITYFANDGCGNISKIDFTVTVRDCKPPVAYCRGVILELMPTGMVELWASDIDAGSFDNCSNPITFSFDAAGTQQARIFDCLNLGSNLVQLFVTDAVGNQSICETFVIIQSDNLADECSDLINPLITGAVTTEIGDEVEGSMISINGSMDAEMMTETNGSFSMRVEAGGDYSVSATKDDQPLNGVTTFDLVLLRKHILSILPLNSPYKIIAADVNNSRSVTTLDMVLIRKLILGVATEFAQTESWRFVNAAYEFPDATNPWLEDFPEVVNINNIANGETKADFVAIKMGDVNDSAVPNNLVTTDERSDREVWNIEVADLALTANQTYEVPFYASDLDIEGYQFTLNFATDKVNIIDLKAGSATTENFGTNFLADGQLTASWDGKLADADEPLFIVVLQSQLSANLSEVFSISSDFVQAEAYSLNNNVKDISLFFMFGTDIEDDYMLAQNTPNPFTNQTEIRFTLPKAATATLTITDLAGRVVWQKTAAYAAGLQSEIVEAAELKTNGVFFYHLQADNFRASRRMIQLAK